MSANCNQQPASLRGKRLGALLALGLTVFALPVDVSAYPLVIVEARGGDLKPGGKIDSAARVSLKPGDKLVVIGPDGKISTVRGTYAGAPVQGGGSVQNARVALSALISTRNDRANTVGAVRSGSSAAPLPDPWLIDISRPGERCTREGERPVWWRPSAEGEAKFAVYPIDRSWRADFVWKDGDDRMRSPPLMRLEGVRMLIIKTGDQERPVRLNIIPKDIDDPVVLTAWMLEKACVQQADALLREIEAKTATAANQERSS